MSGLAAEPSRVAAQKPGLRFMLASPWHLIALGAGSGLPRFAPGTWGTVLGWLLFLYLEQSLSAPLMWLLAVVMLLIGGIAAQVTGRRLGAADSGHIVIDEIVAFWLVLLMLPAGTSQGGGLLVAAFLAFRFFDIVKPPPIRALDARIKNGAGVMLDDLVAAFYALLVLAIGVRLWR
jgi:phosphatidylglycerophosphatase A